MIPAKGNRWVRRNSTHRENGVDLPCVYVVTSYNKRWDLVYVKPTWNTPGKCKPWGVSLHGEESWITPGTWSRKPFAEEFDPE